MANKKLANQIPSVKLFLTDVDGCLTEGGMFYSEHGEELKRFNVYDGMGLVLLREAGIRCGILSSEHSLIVKARAERLKLDFLYLGVGSTTGQPVTRYDFTSNSWFANGEVPQLNKLQAAQRICDQLDITLAEVCYVGDDVNDVDLLKAVGYPCCPPNARPEVKAVSVANGAKADIHVLQTPGGHGAIREIADLILAGLH